MTAWSCTRDHVTEPCGDCDGCRAASVAPRMLTHCATGQCPRAPRWQYVVEYNQDEGYVSKQFCDIHADRNAPGWRERVELRPTPDRHLASAVGWPGG